MDLDYFLKINNTYGSSSKQETDLYLLNRQVDDSFSDSIDYHIVERNGKPIELLIIKDRDGNTYKKKIKSKHSNPINLGDYILWNNQYWIITLVDPDEKAYHSGYMCLCTVLLRYQNKDGDIIERWCYSEDFTKYSSGVTGNSVLTLPDFQYGLTLPVDDETKFIRRDMRFVIDIEGVYPPETYKLTNRKVLLSDNRYFHRGGLINLTLSHDVFNDESDKLVTLDDGTRAWICDYHSPAIQEIPSENKNNILSHISGRTDLKIGYPRTYETLFTDASGNDVDARDVNFHWNVESKFGDKIHITSDPIQKCTLLINDDSLVGESFLLQLITNGNITSELTITVEDIY